MMKRMAWMMFFSMHQDIKDMLSEALKKDEVANPIRPELAEIIKQLWTQQKVGNSKTVKEKIENGFRIVSFSWYRI